MSDLLLDAAARAKHDLGKYIAFQTRWLPEGASHQEWTDALQADLVKTRRGPDGAESAVAIWERIRGDFGPLGKDDDIAGVDHAMGTIRQFMPALERGTITPDNAQVLAQASREVAQRLAALHRRLKEG